MKKAGTVIPAVSVLIWAAMTFPSPPPEIEERFEFQRQAIVSREEAGSLGEDAATEQITEIDNQEMQSRLTHSVAGRLGASLEVVTGPAGFDWRTNIALIGGVAAKEVVISTLGTAYSLGNVDAEEDT
ncbi:MAG: ferrous iron transport protein B, partial [Deltaproteobacteria bacterium]|nr:ferrous iron transport protein B [Deltaproteobacteria bacterium]